MWKKVVWLVIVLVCLVYYVSNVYSVVRDIAEKSISLSKEVYEKDVILKKGENGVVQTIDNDVENQMNVIRRLLMSDKEKVVIIDAGHGGNDPGKIGVHNELEKDINLQIAYKLRNRLTEMGYGVVMTRTEDEGLYSSFASNKKMSDMRKRVELVNSTEAICMISIHQNAFTSSNERGAQVFYHSASDMSERLAKNIQDDFKMYHDSDNTRKEKEGSSYYILKKTLKPAVIVECGFLSNPEESKNLTEPTYQMSIVNSICIGITKWANSIIEGNSK